jgi:hypothetical protein
MNDEDKACLGRIRDKYGAMLVDAAMRFGHKPEILAGIIMQETRGGESSLLKDSDGIPDGNPADDTGDAGHGHGLMQIDDRSFPEFCSSENWKDPAKNIAFGAQVLAEKRHFLATKKVPWNILERASVAAYNCGGGNVLKAHEAGEDLDSRTTGHCYSARVLAFAEQYRISAPADLPAIPLAIRPESPEPKQASAGGLGLLWQLILKIFIGGKAVDNAKHK